MEKFRRFLTTACLLGGAIVIWLTILGSVITGVALAAVYTGSDDSGSSKGAPFTDKLGKTCGVYETHLDPNYNDLLCP